ncbi:MAG: hypothetical protein RJA55_1405 [Acidobacteriota bacterium]|jgi:heat shock protein HslJ
MNAFRSLLSLLVVTSLMVGCSQSPSTPTSPSSVTAGQLAGVWNVVSIQSTGQPEQTVPAGTSYTVTFDDGRLSTRLDCNVCSGAFALSGQTLAVGPVLACTRAACATMAFGDAYIRVLTGDSTLTLVGGPLVLSSARGVLRFMR